MDKPIPAVRVIPSAERAHWWNEWLDSTQSFPATGNFDLEANAHGILLVHNDDIVDAGAGFDTHEHREMEIITWVLEGTVVHQDSLGNSGLIYPGLAQRMSAGTGIRHSERNGAVWPQREPLRVVQMCRRIRVVRRPATRRWMSTPNWPGTRWSWWPPACDATATGPPSPSATGTPPCTWPGWIPAIRSASPTPRSGTCTSPRAAWISKATARSPTATPCDSPRPADTA
ncbi:conserved protein of unknown function; putative cupin and pirin domains [Nocardia cyriacigeorgica GUH-2]|uniref:Pirin N-terminal domain-containing protein n=2 Tax=Nocardia TaxID=1817 RepID=H6R2X9_NOCCG|nr:conserved protein of unknown function; putative cupin and pirin domains [Nocardia cyriacigeorgica GUH-2]